MHLLCRAVATSTEFILSTLRATSFYDFYSSSFYSKVFVPFGATPIESIVFVLDKRNPRGATLQHFA